MPTYQYRCTACSEPLEAVQAFTDAPLTECPTCGGALRKVFSTVGVVFKGSGFYKNDSRPAPKSESAESATKDGEAANAPASGDKAGKDGKAADKPAEKSGEKKSDKPAKKAEAGSGSPKVA